MCTAPTGEGKDSMCTEGGENSVCTGYIQSNSVQKCTYSRKSKNSASGGQTEAVPSRVGKTRLPPVDYRAHKRQIQVALQGTPQPIQGTLHSQQLRRLRQTKCLVDLYSRPAKPGNRWRPVIDLSSLNKFLAISKFKMETPESIRASLRKGEWVTSIDLTNAYLHMPIHTQSQKYLRFHFSVASQNSLEISDASGHTDPMKSEDDTTRGMVVRPLKCACATRRISPPQGTNLYRCLKCRLGRSLRSKFYRRALVSYRKASSHQPIRNEGGSSGSARHVPGSLNVIADGLSRRNQIQSTEWFLSPQIFKQISKLWESPQEDLFTTSLNKIPDPQAWAVDALNIPWEHLVSSHRLAAHGCTKTLISNVQDNSDCPRLADKTMVLGPGGDVSGYSKTTTTYTHSAETATEQPLPCQPNIPEPPRLVSLSSALQERGFTAEVAERIAAPQRVSTRSIYTSKWSVFQRWCTEKQVDFRNPSIGDICNFFWYLFNDLNRCPSTIEGYRTAIADTLGNTRQNISTEIARLIASFHRDKPKSSRSIPKWNLSLVLQRLTQPPFEPQEEASLKFLTWKTVFLLALASGKIHAWTLDGLLCLGDWDQIQLSPFPSIPKKQLAKEGPQSISPVVIPAMKCSQDSQDTDILLCPLRALQCYLHRTKDSRGGRQLLFISYKLGHSKDIQCSTISSWIKNTIKFCYTKVDNADMDLIGVKAHDIRDFAASKAFYAGISMDQIMQACHWKSHNRVVPDSTTEILQDKINHRPLST